MKFPKACGSSPLEKFTVERMVAIFQLIRYTSSRVFAMIIFPDRLIGRAREYDMKVMPPWVIKYPATE